MDLKTVVKKLQQFADPSFAESWDNVGLLVEPTPPHEVCPITGCFGNYLFFSRICDYVAKNITYKNLIRKYFVL